MNYIHREIEENIEIYSGTSDVKVYLQMRIEFYLIYMLAHFWSKNYNRIPNLNTKNEIVKRLIKPTIGTIIHIIQQLDVDNEIPESGKLFEKYLDFRNSYIGHGYVMPDALEEFHNTLNSVFEEIVDSKYKLLTNETKFILVESFDSNDLLFRGISYNPDKTITKWTCRGNKEDFKVDEIYSSLGLNNYFKVSPFIVFRKPKRIYLYKGIQDMHRGTVAYNRIDESETGFSLDWKVLSREMSSTDSKKRKTPNGTIINMFSNNYDTFIRVGVITDSILEYLTGSKRNYSSTITVWGHGGIGKTATVQYICELLSDDTNLKGKDKFSNIIFLSAKDRLYNTDKSITETIKNGNVSTFEQVVEEINEILFDEVNVNIEKILKYDRTTLLVVDDFETFNDENKRKIIDFVEKLDGNVFKVLITTRNRFLEIGKGISTSELSPEETVDFFLQVLVERYKYNPQQIDKIKKDIIDENMSDSIYLITTGRPLFIFTLANYFAQMGGQLSTVLKQSEVKDISSHPEAIDFLYGRVYDQLNQDVLAQDIFCVIGLLTPKDKLSSLISHLKYVLNRFRNEDEDFESAFKKLLDLKIVILQGEFYKIYSKEILELMYSKYQHSSSANRGVWNSRFRTIETNLSKETGEALLLYADSSRNSGQTEQYVVDKYSELINIDTIPEQIRITALLNLTEYLYNSRGNKFAAVDKFENYIKLFKNFDVVWRYSEYLWSMGGDFENQSIQVLRKYYDDNKKKTNAEGGRFQKIRMLATIVLRLSLYWDHKAKSNKGQVNKISLKTEYKNVYSKYGHLLIIDVKNSDFSSFDPATRQDVLTSIISLLNLLSKIDKMDAATNLSLFILDEVKNIPPHMLKEFRRYTKGRIEIDRRSDKTKSTEQVIAFQYPNIDVYIVYFGEVEAIDQEKRFGFLKCSNLPLPIYFHESGFESGSFDDVRKRDVLEFSIKTSNTDEPIVTNGRLFAQNINPTW